MADQPKSATWDAARYDDQFGYVSAYGVDLVELMEYLPRRPRSSTARTESSTGSTCSADNWSRTCGCGSWRWRIIGEHLLTTRRASVLTGRAGDS